jgi:hypothetical protein
MPQRHQRRFFTAAVALTATGLLLFAVVERDTAAPDIAMTLKRSSAAPLAVDDTIDVTIAIESTRPINALHGALTYSSSTLTLISTSTQTSFLNLWPQKPHRRSTGVIAFEGGTYAQEGFTGTDTVFTAQFRATTRGTATLEVHEAVAYAHDGSGKQLPVARAGTIRTPISASLQSADGDNTDTGTRDTSAGHDTQHGDSVSSTTATESEVRLSVLLHALFQRDYRAAADLNEDGKNTLRDLSIYFSR